MTPEEIAKIKEQIAVIDKKLENKALADVFKKKFEEQKAKLVAQLPTEKAKPKKERKTAVKDKDKPVIVAAATEKLAKEKKTGKDKVVYIHKGKPVPQETIDLCKDLYKDFEKRREAARARSGKVTPTTTKVAKNVVNSAKTAIQAVPVKKIKENPKVVINKMERLEKAAEEYLDALQDFLGDKFKAAQAKKEMKEITSAIAAFKKKYSKS